MRFCILCKKLGFLWRVLNPKKNSIYVDVFNSLRGKQIEPLLVQQCKFLEKIYGTHFTETLLMQHRDEIECPLTIKAVWKQLEDMDRDYIWMQVSSRESLTHWLRLWDDTRDYGLPGARALEAFLRTLTIPVFGGIFLPYVWP